MGIIKNEGKMVSHEKKRVCAYCRVSCLSDVQDGSYEEQERYFTRKIQEDPSMIFVGIYGDHGKSGREMRKRAGMKKLLADAREHKFDLVLCKSVSRWARNLTEFVATVRELKSLGVAVLFEKEGLDTSDDRNDLVLGIIGTVAAGESESISMNVLWARKKHVEAGEPWDKPRYGYHMEMPGHRWVVTPSEAERVKRAFFMAGKGFCYEEITAELNRMERRDGTERLWKNNTVANLLHAYVYTGDYLSNKEITIITPQGERKRVKNRGQQDQVLIEGHHKALVSHELYDIVQTMIENGLLHSSLKNFPPESVELLKRASEIADKEGA